MTREEKLTELLKNDEVAKEIFVEDVDQTLANLAAHGVEMNQEELGELCVGMLDGMGIAEDELSEEKLEDVAGGFSLSSTLIGMALKDVGNALKGGISAGKSDKKKKSNKGMGYVEEANTVVGKGWRAIGYTIGRLF